MIKIKTSLINNSLLTNELLSAYIDLFWKKEKVFEQLTKGPGIQHLMIMCKASFNAHIIETGYRTLGHLRRLFLMVCSSFILPNSGPTISDGKGASTTPLSVSE